MTVIQQNYKYTHTRTYDFKKQPSQLSQLSHTVLSCKKNNTLSNIKVSTIFRKVSTILGSTSTILGKCQPNTGNYLKNCQPISEKTWQKLAYVTFWVPKSDLSDYK